jgi:hypothetical protein
MRTLYFFLALWQRFGSRWGMMHADLVLIQIREVSMVFMSFLICINPLVAFLNFPARAHLTPRGVVSINGKDSK